MKTAQYGYTARKNHTLDGQAHFDSREEAYSAIPKGWSWELWQYDEGDEEAIRAIEQAEFPCSAKLVSQYRRYL